MSKPAIFGGTKRKKLNVSQRNLAGEIIAAGEFVKVSQSKEDPNLIDITSVSSPKRTIKNIPLDSVES